MSEPMNMFGEVEFSIRFHIKDLVALVKAHPKEWKKLNADRIEALGYGRDDAERFPVFLDQLLETRIDVNAFDDKNISFDVDWNNTHYRWSRESAAALMQALPPDMHFEDGELAEPKIETPQPMEGDQSLLTCKTCGHDADEHDGTAEAPCMKCACDTLHLCDDPNH